MSENNQIYVAIVSYENNNLACSEIFSAIGRDAIIKECENHCKKWLKSLARKKIIKWSGGYVENGDMSFHVSINKPHYRTYPASYFEYLKVYYPEQRDYLDNLYMPDIEDRAAKLIGMFSENQNLLSGNSSIWVYAKEELEKIGYVYEQGKWYPPQGIFV